MPSKCDICKNKIWHVCCNKCTDQLFEHFICFDKISIKDRNSHMG